MTTLTLHEWTTAPGLALTTRQRDAVRDVFGAVVQPTAGTDGAYDVTPAGTVGAVRIAGVTVVVRPKIPISRILFLLGYSADPAFRPNDADMGDEPDLLEGAARLLATLAERALRHGVLRGYRTVAADLHTVRGRIDLAEQLRRRPGQILPLAVQYQEHEEDILENRLLVAAVHALRRAGTRHPDVRRSLRKLQEQLAGVADAHFPPSAVPPVVWTRLNGHLRPAVELARLLLRLRSPDLTAGPVAVPGLTIDMAALFETFVRTAMREALRSDGRRFPPGHECPPLHLDARRSVRLYPDLSHWPRGACKFVGDAKYKRNTATGHNADLYQLLAYATAAGLDDATLVYAFGPPEPRTHSVAGTAVRLHVRHVDLSAPPAALLAQIASLTSETVPGRRAADVPA